MASMTAEVSAAQTVRVVFGGIDTHKDIHVVALVDGDGGLVGSAAFPTTVAGYRQLQVWLPAAGAVARVGVEGTGTTAPGSAGSCTLPGSRWWR